MKYRLEVILSDTANTTLLYQGISRYSLSDHDDLEVRMDCISVEFARKGDRDLDKFIFEPNSTISRQLTKALCFVYLIGRKRFDISKVVISRFKNGTVNEKREYCKINQPFSTDLPDSYIFTSTDLECLFSDFLKSEYMMIALVYFIKAINSSLEGNKFERLWRSFNSLYSAISGKDHENEKLIFMRGFIENNKVEFNNTLNMLDLKSKDDIRSIRWRELILNDYDIESKTQYFKGFIERYEDFRMNEIFYDILPYRREYLANAGLISDVEKHIRAKKCAMKKNNVDLLCFYILKYCYFLRNKYFHAEKIDPCFQLIKNNEIIELKTINDLFGMFMYELIKCNRLF